MSRSYTKEQQKKLILRARSLLPSHSELEPSTDHAASGQTDITKIKSLISELREVIQFLDWKYYVDSQQALADVEYDQLFKWLQKLESEHPQLRTPDSPTQRVARGLSEEFQTVPHAVPMLSLDNSYNEEDLLEFDKRVRQLTGTDNIAYSVEPKFDGSSISLLYENDLLVRAATRGDGIQGEEITNNVRVIRSIPLRVDFSSLGIQKAEVRGEVVIDKAFFARMNEEREQQGLKTFQNPRNTAAGALRMKDPAEVGRRGLETIIFHLAWAVDAKGNNLLKNPANDLSGHFELIKKLGLLGFKIPENAESHGNMKVCHSVEEILTFIRHWETERDNYRFEIDGMVIKVNDLAMQQLAGATAHHPRWAIAFKFKARQATTRLLEVDYQVGRTGVITPVAKLEPVQLGGVTISSVSLHNEDQIKEKDIRIGDLLKVERAGDVIPYISGPVTEVRSGSESPIRFPDHCPSCNGPLVREKEEVAWRCVNAECPAQTEERLIHFVSKSALDIQGLGRDIIIRFHKEGLLSVVPDVFRLSEFRQKILAFEGWKEKSLSNLLTSIEEAKNRPLWRLINGMGIRHVGTVTAKALARETEDVFELQKIGEDQLTDIADIGPIVAASIHHFFSNPGNIEMLTELRDLGVNTAATDEDRPKQGVLNGATFLFTGSLQQMKRDRAKELVEAHGGRNVSGVSANLNYLVCGEKAGSKKRKAEKIEGIRIISEADFLQMISGNE